MYSQQAKTLVGRADTGNGIISARTQGSPATNCLPTGNRNLADIDTRLVLSANFNDATHPLRFDYLNFSSHEGVIVIYEPNTTRQRCLVVSAGPGLIRTGYYQGNPNTLNINNCEQNKP